MVNILLKDGNATVFVIMVKLSAVSLTSTVYCCDALMLTVQRSSGTSYTSSSSSSYLDLWPAGS